MANRTRPIILRLAVTEYEKQLIENKMKQLGTKNFGAYARKMLIDGYIIKVDYTQQKKLAAAVSRVIKNIDNYQRLKPVYEAYQKAKDKTAFRAKHEAELVIFEAAKSTLLAVQGDGKLPSMKALQAEQERLTEEQQRLYDERAKLKKEAKQIDTIKANVDSYLRPIASQEQKIKRRSELE